MGEHPDPDVLAEQMAPVALEYVRRVRTDPPLALWRDLVAPLDGWQQAALIALLAAAVDPSVHPDILWGWVRHRDVIEHPSPIVWDHGELPIEEMGSAQINVLIGELAGRGRTARQIADEIGLSVDAVAKRQERIRRQAAAGVG